ncbi:MAG: hypothetical protein ACOYL3_29120 [Desulfuromonadaceae bacterium]|nr:hypothetical protein [Pseudomonadota bacterium]
MLKTVSAVLIVAMLSTSTAFATDTAASSVAALDNQAPNHLSAFDGVQTANVGDEELKEVSGKFGPLLVVAVVAGVLGFGIAGKIANKIQNGKWSVPKAR